MMMISSSSVRVVAGAPLTSKTVSTPLARTIPVKPGGMLVVRCPDHHLEISGTGTLHHTRLLHMLRVSRTTVLTRRVVRMQASSNKSTDFDFDAALASVAEKVCDGRQCCVGIDSTLCCHQFEKADNKPALLGWGVAGLSVFFFAEWLIHLPGLNFVRSGGLVDHQMIYPHSPPQLLGFPIQLLGLVMLPYLVVRYYVDGADLAKDAGDAVVCGVHLWECTAVTSHLCTPQTSVTSKLPGLEKK